MPMLTFWTLVAAVQLYRKGAIMLMLWWWSTGRVGGQGSLLVVCVVLLLEVCGIIRNAPYVVLLVVHSAW